MSEYTVVLIFKMIIGTPTTTIHCDHNVHCQCHWHAIGIAAIPNAMDLGRVYLAPRWAGGAVGVAATPDVRRVCTRQDQGSRIAE